MYKVPCLSALFLFLAACAPLTVTSPTPAPTATRLPTRMADPAPPALAPGTRIIIRSSSQSLIVDDPAEALAELEQAVQEAGGFVVSASYYSSPDYAGYSSLSAKVPPESLAELRRAASAIASEVQSDNVYSQDVTSEYRLLQGRLNRLRESEEQLWQLVIETKDHRFAESLTLLRELIETEIDSVQSQILSYEDRSIFASFDVTLNQTTQTRIILD